MKNTEKLIGRVLGSRAVQCSPKRREHKLKNCSTQFKSKAKKAFNFCPWPIPMLAGYPESETFEKIIWKENFVTKSRNRLTKNILVLDIEEILLNKDNCQLLDFKLPNRQSDKIARLRNRQAAWIHYFCKSYWKVKEKVRLVKVEKSLFPNFPFFFFFFCKKCRRQERPLFDWSKLLWDYFSVSMLCQIKHVLAPGNWIHFSFFCAHEPTNHSYSSILRKNSQGFEL